MKFRVGAFTDLGRTKVNFVKFELEISGGHEILLLIFISLEVLCISYTASPRHVVQQLPVSRKSTQLPPHVTKKT